ncbi:MAG: ATP-binding protein [Polyangiales bacterium]
MSRIERKIIFVILFVALVPLFGSIWLGRRILHQTYSVGVNEQFGKQLEKGVEARREYLLALRDSANRTVDTIAARLVALDATGREIDRASLTSMVDEYPSVLAIRVARRADGAVGTSDVFVERAAENDAFKSSTMQRELSMRSGDVRTLEVTIGAPKEAFEELQQAGDAAEIYSRLRKKSTIVEGVYLRVYGLLLTAVIAVALVVGIVLSRRVTKRITALAAAASRVGKGDFTVEVPIESTDELSELTSSFNEMVRSLRENRERIAYLQRIGAWQEFARRLAHEIKNPLTPIQLAVQEVDDTYDGDNPTFAKKLASARTIVEEEIATLRRLVGEFTAFAKLPQPELENADMVELLASVSNTIPAILQDVGGAEPARSAVHIENETTSLSVRMDPMMMKRAIDNLVRNAIQEVHEHRPDDGAVWIQTRREGDFAVVELRDNGRGIPHEHWEYVFDPYFTTKASGTGLGLPIVKKITLEHGGEITLNDAPEGGACFKLSVPLLTGKNA